MRIEINKCYKCEKKIKKDKEHIIYTIEDTINIFKVCEKCVKEYTLTEMGRDFLPQKIGF